MSNDENSHESSHESSHECAHLEIDYDGTCMECGQCDIIVKNLNETQSVFPQRRYVINSDERKMLHFTNIMNIRSGKQNFRLKDPEYQIIYNTLYFLYDNNFNERCVRSVLKKLKLNKYINDSYLIYCIMKGVECERFDMYEDYFSYIYKNMYKEYCKLYPFKYFINSSYILSMLLNEVGLSNRCSYHFKNIDTYEYHTKIYYQLRKLCPLTYEQFTRK